MLKANDKCDYLFTVSYSDKYYTLKWHPKDLKKLTALVRKSFTVDIFGSDFGKQFLSLFESP